MKLIGWIMGNKIIVIVIAIVLIAMAYIVLADDEIIDDIGEGIGDIIDDTADTEYPTGWNVPGDVNYMTFSLYTGAQYDETLVMYTMNYYSHVTNANSISITSLANMPGVLEHFLTAGYITQSQYETGISQVNALAVA